MDPNMTLPSNTMWGGGGLGGLMMPLVTILISVAMMYMLRELVKGGVTKLVTPSADPEAPAEAQEAAGPVPTAETAESDGRAAPFDGFDPALYGPAPDDPATEPTAAETVAPDPSVHPTT